MPLMRQQISNSQTHLTDFFGLTAYFILSLDKCSADVGVKSVFQYFEFDKKKNCVYAKCDFYSVCA